MLVLLRHWHLDICALKAAAPLRWLELNSPAPTHTLGGYLQEAALDMQSLQQLGLDPLVSQSPRTDTDTHKQTHTQANTHTNKHTQMSLCYLVQLNSQYLSLRPYDLSSNRLGPPGPSDRHLRSSGIFNIWPRLMPASVASCQAA